MAISKKTKVQTPKKKRTRVSQSDVPAYSLTEALRVAKAIAENYGSSPSKPINVAKAMELSPTSSSFKMLTGASIAYGLTDGGYNATEISLTELGKKIVSPLEEDEDNRGMVEAYLRPKIISEFINKYDGSPIPRKQIAENVLMDLGVPNDRSKNVLSLILDGAQALGMVTEIKGKEYINLSSQTKTNAGPTNSNPTEIGDEIAGDVHPNFGEAAGDLPDPPNIDQALRQKDEFRSKRVFITHGKNTGFIAPIKKLLAFGEMEAVVSVEKQSVSQPVPDKVMKDMRSCGAAIIHVDGELKLMDRETNEHVVLNPNVLIEIGAAMALYGRRFILLVKDGVKLPSNLQGLFEVRYEGETLDGDATIRLLEAINSLKKEPMTPT